MNIKRLIKIMVQLPNDIYNIIIFKYRHVNYGNNLKITGRIFCVSNGCNRIIIENNVHINSSRRSNPIGGDTKTILFAKENGTIRIGNNVGISNCTLVAHEKIVIEDNVLLGGSVKIYDTDFHWVDYEARMNQKDAKTAPVIVKSGAFIGGHSIILKGVTIGQKSVIGAGSIVTRNVPDCEIWAGNPAKFVRKIETK